MGNPKYQNDGEAPRSGPGFGLTIHPDVLVLPQSWREPRTIFVNSMSDLFHESVPIAFIRQVFAVMEATPRHTYQVLTKRSKRLSRISGQLDWPENIWMGVSIESDRYLFRKKDLMNSGARVKFLSLEPLLGPLEHLDLGGIDWVIVGGESGNGSRPIEADWVRAILHSCEQAEVPFFFKQWGGRTPKAGGRILDGRTYDGFPRKEEIQVR
jgi:protein gp37